MPSEITTSGAIHFTGLGNGTDFDAIIEATLTAEGFHKKRLESWQESWVQKKEYFTALNSQMLSLKNEMRSMDTLDEFLKKNVDVSSSSVLSASADSGAMEGSHEIFVKQLAQNEIKTSTFAVATEDTSINSSGGSLVFDYTYGSTSVSLDVPNGTTLAGLRDLINKDNNNPGVRASILYNGSDYFLQVKGMDLGADNSITIDGSTTLTNYGAGGFDDTQLAQNSQITVDGWPNDGTYIELATNAVTQAIEGVTMNLKATGTTQITIANDTDAIIEQVRTFVDKVNEVRASIRALTKYDEETKKGAILQGNYGLQIVATQIKDVTATKGIGFDYDDDVYSTFAQIGILTDATEGSPTQGLLVFDEADFLEALENDSDAVAELFSSQGTGATDTSDFAFESMIPGITEPGEYAVEYTVDGSGTITAATINGNEATINGNKITGKSGNPESGLSLTINNLNAGTHSGNARVKQGKAGEFYDVLSDLTDVQDGTLKILENNYRDIIKNIQKKIDYEETRLIKLEKTLRLKYARLEETLGTYEQQKKSLESQLKQLSSK
ncbi:flagellar filament capping protein FliD [Desulfobaculum sp. SPO524]|uniref:flagellar filament capping protein FliD n=1 Tax=Desulfobaculum sp. SPO524 TaxID=3378071 RepID=UPI0038543D40